MGKFPARRSSWAGVGGGDGRRFMLEQLHGYVLLGVSKLAAPSCARALFCASGTGYLRALRLCCLPASVFSPRVAPLLSLRASAVSFRNISGCFLVFYREPSTCAVVQDAFGAVSRSGTFTKRTSSTPAPAANLREEAPPVEPIGSGRSRSSKAGYSRAPRNQERVC